MTNKIKPIIIIAAFVLLAAACKKGTFDINNTNPNVPSSVDPQFVLSGALSSSAAIVDGQNITVAGTSTVSAEDFMNLWMGYWALSGDYIPNAAALTYTINSDYAAANWDASYTTIANYRSIEKATSATASGANYTGIAKIMQASHFQRLVDMYNNVPYTAALNGGTNNFPTYDDAKSVYESLVNQIDSAVTVIKAAPSTADNPAKYDVMFGGNMTNWIKFANTLKLKILMRQTQMAGRTAYIQSKLTGLTTADFIVAGADATVNPGYSNAASNQQSPLWSDVGFTTAGSQNSSRTDYYRANSYGVGFYKTTNDPRVSAFYSPTTGGGVNGRPFGSTNSGTEHNSTVSAVGGNATGATQTTGVLKSPSMPAYIIIASESLFLQAEAVQRGLLAGNAATLYQSAVSESFRLLGIAGAAAAATTYTAQTGLGNSVNFASSSDKINTIITQKWAAMNMYDPLESWSDWRRLGIPANLPVSVYPGTSAAHIPYRLPYPTSEFSYNATNVKGQNVTDIISSKIFWMP